MSRGCRPLRKPPVFASKRPPPPIITANVEDLRVDPLQYSISQKSPCVSRRYSAVWNWRIGFDPESPRFRETIGGQYFNFKFLNLCLSHKVSTFQRFNTECEILEKGLFASSTEVRIIFEWMEKQWRGELRESQLSA